MQSTVSLTTFYAAAIMTALTALPMVSRAQTETASGHQWEGSAGAGLTLTKGNSDTVLFNANIQATDKWDKNELRLKASVTYGETDSRRSTQAAEGDAQFNRLFSERAYGGLKINLFHDDIAEIRYRLTVAPLVGYYFIKEPKMTLSGEVGPAFIYAKQGSGTNEDTRGHFTLRLGERFEYKFSDTARIWQTLEFLPQVDDLGNFLVNAELGAEAGLTKKLSLRTVLQDFYNSKPASGRKKNDIRLIAGVNYKF